MGKKIRLDRALVGQGLSASAEEAKRLIMAGSVIAGEERIDKPGTLVAPDTVIRIKRRGRPYASRAGLKLEAALREFQLRAEGLVALDLGASTGGFTDCLLRFGAEKVYAVDVGTNQLAYRLRVDPRVVCLERTHAKNLGKAQIPDPVALLAVDVSFTSLTYVLPFVLPLLARDARGVCLFKPQFEVPREQVGPGGLVEERHAILAIQRMTEWLLARNIEILGTLKSPVKGRTGNQEYFFGLRFSGG